MCRSLETEPGIAQTPSCTDLTTGLCFPSLCQVSPTVSSLHTLLPSLEPQPPLHRSPAANMPSTLLLSYPAEANAGRPTSLPSVRWHMLAGAGCRDLAQQLSWNHEVILSPSASLSFSTWEILTCGPTHLSSFSQTMSVSDFLQKPPTSSSPSHTKNENNPGNYPDAYPQIMEPYTAERTDNV